MLKKLIKLIKKESNLDLLTWARALLTMFLGIFAKIKEIWTLFCTWPTHSAWSFYPFLEIELYVDYISVHN